MILTAIGGEMGSRGTCSLNNTSILSGVNVSSVARAAENWAQRDGGGSDQRRRSVKISVGWDGQDRTGRESFPWRDTCILHLQSNVYLTVHDKCRCVIKDSRSSILSFIGSSEDSKRVPWLAMGEMISPASLRRDASRIDR
jgi:hypothetical protein